MMIDKSIFGVHSYSLADFLSDRSRACPHIQSMACCTKNSWKTFGLKSLLRMEDRWVFRTRNSHRLPCVIMLNYLGTPVNLWPRVCLGEKINLHMRARFWPCLTRWQQTGKAWLRYKHGRLCLQGRGFIFWVTICVCVWIWWSYIYEDPTSACVLAQRWYTTWITTDMRVD